jgi:hypothetical protein
MSFDAVFDRRYKGRIKVSSLNNLLARLGADSRNGCFPESVSRDEIMRPERPKRERGQGGLPPDSPASRTEGNVIEPICLAQKNSLPLHEVYKLSQVGTSNG